MQAIDESPPETPANWRPFTPAYGTGGLHRVTRGWFAVLNAYLLHGATGNRHLLHPRVRSTT